MSTDTVMLARMAEAAVQAEYAGPAHRVIGLVEAVCFARLAAHNGSEGDIGRLIAMLGLLSQELADNDENALADSFAGEAIALIDILADQGAEIADLQMPRLAEHSTPGALTAAKRLREIWENDQ